MEIDKLSSAIAPDRSFAIKLTLIRPSSEAVGAPENGGCRHLYKAIKEQQNYQLFRRINEGIADILIIEYVAREREIIGYTSWSSLVGYRTADDGRMFD